jgi:hypothetical protein
MVLASVLAGACRSVSKPAGDQVAPEFTYITRQQLDFTMWRLARDVRELDELLRVPGSIDAARRSAIVAHLVSMETAAADLKTQTGWHSNQPGVDAHLGRFEADAVRARRAVEGEPPNYYLAGYVAGACLYCHGVATEP